MTLPQEAKGGFAGTPFSEILCWNIVDRGKQKGANAGQRD